MNTVDFWLTVLGMVRKAIIQAVNRAPNSSDLYPSQFRFLNLVINAVIFDKRKAVDPIMRSSPREENLFSIRKVGQLTKFIGREVLGTLFFGWC